MKCIYCHQDAADARGLAHVLPEAVVRNDLVLPLGTVCDPCNNYLGKLDSALVAHPMVSFGIQALRLPGKSGKLRKRVGNVYHGNHGKVLNIPTGPPIEHFGPQGRTLSVSPLVDAQFDEGRFRRALHHVALNLVAHADGAEVAASSAYDSVRTYVRKPKRLEMRPFAQLALLGSFPKEANLVIDSFGEATVVGILLPAVHFYVEVSEHGKLAEYVEHSQAKMPTLQFIGSDQRLARVDKESGPTRWRISIHLDD